MEYQSSCKSVSLQRYFPLRFSSLYLITRSENKTRGRASAPGCWWKMKVPAMVWVESGTQRDLFPISASTRLISRSCRLCVAFRLPRESELQRNVQELCAWPRQRELSTNMPTRHRHRHRHKPLPLWSVLAQLQLMHHSSTQPPYPH